MSILSAGTFVGALAAAPLADQLGRRRALMIAAGVFSIGVTLQVASRALPLYVAGRYVVSINYARELYLLSLDLSLALAWA